MLMQRGWKISCASSVWHSNAQDGRLREDGEAVGLKVRFGDGDCDVERHSIGPEIERTAQPPTQGPPIRLEPKSEDITGYPFTVNYFAQAGLNLVERDCDLAANVLP